jgi:hypothetical protein
MNDRLLWIMTFGPLKTGQEAENYLIFISTPLHYIPFRTSGDDRGGIEEK